MLKSAYTFFVCSTLFLTALHPANAAPTDPVTIPDANLKAAIESGLSNHQVGDPITEAKMATLTGLNVRSAVSNLEGLQYATSLTSITLRPNGYQNFNDLSPIRNLPLNRLFIRFNLWINNFSVLGDLPETFDALTLQLTNLSESDLESFLPHLTGLGLLSIRQSNISDLSSLNDFTGKLYQLDVRSLGPQGNGLALKDLKPLVEFAKTKIRDAPNRNVPRLEVSQNYRLNYASIYEHLPEILRIMDKIDRDNSVDGDGPASFQYDASTPSLQRVSPETVIVRLGETHTHTVRGVNTTGTNTNQQFEGVPVEWRVDGGPATRVPTRSDGLSSFTFTPRNRRTYTVEAIVPAKETVLPATATKKIEHPQLRVPFTTIVDITAPPFETDSPDGLTVSFEDYPTERPIDEFTLTIKFSEPVIGFETEDITLQTKLTTGKGVATLTTLTPQTPIHADSPAPDPIQTYTATVQLPDAAGGTVRLIVGKDAATTPATATLEKTGPSSDTASDFIDFGPALDEDARFRHPPALVVTHIDFTKGSFSVQNTTQYRFNVEMRIYSEDHKDKWFRVSERDLITIEDAETLTFSLTPIETDTPSIIHLNNERLLSRNQNQPLKLSSQKFCIKLMRVIPVDTASNMNEDFRVKEIRWNTPGDVIYRQYDASWDVKLKGLRRDHLAYYRFPLDGQLSDSWDVEASVPAAPSVSRVQSEVVLSQFRSASTASGVLVEWTTASERANAGFYVLRSRNSKSGFVRVSPVLIVGTGTTTEGQTYSWRDTTAAVNVPYYYRLEEVSLYGERRALATVRLRGFISSAGKLLWKWADVKTFEKGW